MEASSATTPNSFITFTSLEEMKSSGNRFVAMRHAARMRRTFTRNKLFHYQPRLADPSFSRWRTMTATPPRNLGEKKSKAENGPGARPLIATNSKETIVMGPELTTARLSRHHCTWDTTNQPCSSAETLTIHECAVVKTDGLIVDCPHLRSLDDSAYGPALSIISTLQGTYDAAKALFVSLLAIQSPGADRHVLALTHQAEAIRILRERLCQGLHNRETYISILYIMQTEVGRGDKLDEIDHVLMVLADTFGQQGYS